MAMNFKDMSLQAPYRLAEMDHATYMLTHVPSCWSTVPGWTLHTTVYDIMHNLFLGTGRDVVASSLRLMLETGCFDHYGVPRDSDSMFAKITEEIHASFKASKFSGGILTKKSSIKLFLHVCICLSIYTYMNVNDFQLFEHM